MIWAIIIAAIIMLDQAVKQLVATNIPMNTATAIIDRFFYLTYIRNSGAAWSMFENGRYFFIVTTILISILLVYFLYRKADNIVLKISLSFIIGGAVGNLIDRIYAGSVVDFLRFDFGSYTFPIFNVADCFVVIGTIILAYYLLFIYKEKDENKDAE